MRTFFAIIVALFLTSVSTTAQQTGKVQITSLNVKDEIVPFINVVIEGNGIRRELQTRGVGDEYENGGLVELPVGTYRVTIRNTNYFDFRRSAFRVRPGVVTTINVFPLNYVLAQMLMSDGSDRSELAAKPSYDVYDISHRVDNDISMLVRYDKKHAGGDFVDYESRRHVMVSYDALAIYAEKVRFDRKKFILTAEGDVTVEDGTQRIKANNVTVRFNKGTPEVVTN